LEIGEYVAVPSLHHGILVHLCARHEPDLLEHLRDHRIVVLVRRLHQSTLQDRGNWLRLRRQQQLAISIAPEIRGLVVDLEYFAAQLELLRRRILVLLVRWDEGKK
jgi:hypothetical protein